MHYVTFGNTWSDRLIPALGKDNMSAYLDLNDVAATSDKAQEELARIIEVLRDAEFLMRKAGQLAGPMQDSFNRAAVDCRELLEKF